jgi:hypothetical protein
VISESCKIIKMALNPKTVDLHRTRMLQATGLGKPGNPFLGITLREKTVRKES